MDIITWVKMKKSDLHIFKQRRKILSGEKRNYSNPKSFLERDMLILAHSLEKGMGIPNTRIGYGQEKAYLLASKLKKYEDEYNTNSFPFLESIAVLDKYIELMHEQGVNIDKIESERATFEKEIIIKNHCKAGFYNYNYGELVCCKSSILESILSSRHSVRHYSKDEITAEELKEVVSLANMAPSACNRQPVKLFYTKTQEKAFKFEKLVNGSQGFQGEIPYYMLVTVDRAYFGTDEFLQWYINGGIYLGFLTLAFHSRGIGSIILQWKYAQECEKEVKDLFGIEPNEAIIALIGYGKYPKDGTKCIIAQRKRPEDTIIGV